MKTLSLLFFIFLLFSCTRSGKDLVSEVERQSPLVTNDISNQQITAFGEDGKGHIWIGTFRGLNKFSVNEYHHIFVRMTLLIFPTIIFRIFFLIQKSACGYRR